MPLLSVYLSVLASSFLSILNDISGVSLTRVSRNFHVWVFGGDLRAKGIKQSSETNAVCVHFVLFISHGALNIGL